MEINSHWQKNQILLPSNKDLHSWNSSFNNRKDHISFLANVVLKKNATEITVSSRIKHDIAYRGWNSIHVAKRNMFSQRSNQKE